VDFSAFISFEMMLKVDEGREGETVSILHIFFHHFAAQTPV
jgi:hypothetical protein